MNKLQKFLGLLCIKLFSSGERFGDPEFYRILAIDDKRYKV